MPFRTRATMGGLMWAVVAIALGLAAIRSGSSLWAGVTLLATLGVMALAVIAVVCDGRSVRPWWVGFSVFGLGYVAAAFLFQKADGWHVAWMANHLIDWVFRGVDAPMGGVFSGRREDYRRIWDIVNCLAALLAALAGGLLARWLFPPAAVTAEAVPHMGSIPATPDRRGRWVWLVFGAALLAYFITAVLGSRTAPGAWAGATVLLTWALLATAAMAAFFRSGRARARWFGVAVFGAGYLALVSGRPDEETWPQLATNRVLLAVRSWLPEVPVERTAGSDAVARANARVLKALDEVVPMDFPEPAPLEDVLKYIVAFTRTPDGRELPIYVDPVGLQEAEKTVHSPVVFDMDDVPLRTSLRLILRQLGLLYVVKDGVVMISSDGCIDVYDEPSYDDPLLVTGQCFLALGAAGLGGWLAPLVCARRSESS